MRLVRSKDTGPEVLVRRMLHAMGYRYRLHVRRLPGAPDIVFAGRRKVIFVHGCFWHRHKGCPNNRLPRTRTDFWLPKLEGNRKRDLANQRKLKRLGWHVLIIWECWLKDRPSLTERLMKFLEENP